MGKWASWRRSTSTPDRKWVKATTAEWVCRGLSPCQMALTNKPSCLISGTHQIPSGLPILATNLPLSHQDVASQHLRGKLSSLFTDRQERDCLAEHVHKPVTPQKQRSATSANGFFKVLRSQLITGNKNFFDLFRMEMCASPSCTRRWMTLRAGSFPLNGGTPPRTSG